MRMHKPAHPGEILKEMYLTPLGLTVSEAAKGFECVSQDCLRACKLPHRCQHLHGFKTGEGIRNHARILAEHAAEL